MRINILLLIVLFCALKCTVSSAQSYNLEGQVIDSSQNAVAFANVVLLSEDKAILFGTITDENGSFIISDRVGAAYKIKVSFVGFEDYVSPLFTLSGNKKLDPIILTESQESLGEVTITARKPTITRKKDRLVFNVENSILSNGSTLDILKRTPGVVVNQDQITVRNEEVTVYLNDRKVHLSAEEVQTLLESIGGDAIKSVEVLMNPPAQYDAEGGPVLNIVSSRAIVTGYKGSLNLRGTYAIFPKHSLGTSHFFKNEKINLFFNYSFNPAKSSLRSDNIINYRSGEDATLWRQDYERKNWSQAHNANLIFDYKLSERSELNISAVGLYSPDIFDFTRSDTDVNSSITGVDPFSIRTSSGIDSERENYTFDVRYIYKTDKGRLSVNSNYNTFNRGQRQSLTSNYKNVDQDIFRRVSFVSDALQDIAIYTSQLDYTTTLGTWGFDIGVKYASIDSQSKIDFLSIQDNGNSGLDEAQSDDFLYDEDVIAAYISFERDWDSWSFKSGLRAEQTNSKGTSVVLDVINDLDYLEFFPTVYFQYKASEKHSFSLDYSRRLDRPRYEDLNPFAYFLNENNFNTGNAALLPSFSHRFNLNYTLNEAYSFDAYYRDNGDNIVTLAFQNNERQFLRTVRQNAVDSKSWGLDFTHGRSLAKWYYLYSYISAFHEEETFIAVESDNAIYTNEVDGLYAYIGNYITLDGKRGWTAEASVEYISNFLSGSYKYDATTAINIGVQKTFWNKRALLKVTINDLLNKQNARLRSVYLNQDNSFLSRNETQNLQVGFTYKFGNFKLQDNNRELASEESERLKDAE